MPDTGWVTRDYIFYDRVREHTAPVVNERIDLLTQAYLFQARSQGREALRRRLQELDREWDIDRAVMLLFSIAGGVAFTAGITRRRSLLGVLAVQLGFLATYAVRGWAPPVPILRRLGFRTSHEIEAEKHSLLMKLDESEEELPKAV